MAELQKSLSFSTILLISINSIMGTGIFFLPAIAAGAAGNASMISWAAMALIAIGISLFFAELSSMFPTAGGVYEYCKQAFGNFPSFLIGWMTLIVANVTIAMLVVGAIRYLNPLLPNVWKIVFSIMFILLFNFMAFRGLQTSASMLVMFAFITLGSILGLAFPGFFKISPENFVPFLSHAAPSVFLAVFLVAETFFGWETATFLAEETENAERVIPKALIISTLIISCIVLFFVFVSLGVIPWSVFGASQAPLTDLAIAIYGGGGGAIFSILVYVSIIGSVAGWIVSAPRLVMALAKDKMFIEQLGEVHPKHKTPYKAIIFQTLLTSILVVVGAGSYEVLLELLVPLVLVMYASVIVALLVLRRTQPETTRHYRVPLAWILGPILIACLLGLTGFWAFSAHGAVGILRVAGSLLLLGVPVFILLKFTYDPDAVVSSAKFTGGASVVLENVLLPKNARKRFLSLLKPYSKRVLEFGSNVGTMTIHLAEEVGPGGVVYATELSEQNAKIVEKRMRYRGADHVRVIHDEHHLNRVHPDVNQIDIVFSVGYLSYIQDLRKILRELRERLPLNGVVLFVEYVDYFKILPNAGWAANPNQLRAIFREEGFSVTITKQKGLLWNYLIIHGIRTDRDVPFI